RVTKLMKTIQIALLFRGIEDVVGVMTRRFAALAPALLVCASLHAATVNTTLTVTNATGSIGASGINVSGGGATTLSGIGSGTITTGGGGTPTPTIANVQDAASNTATIAQGSIFIVKGGNLSASGFTSYAPPRPTNPNGVKVTFTPVAGGTGTDAFIVYLYNQ